MYWFLVNYHGTFVHSINVYSINHGFFRKKYWNYTVWLQKSKITFFYKGNQIFSSKSWFINVKLWIFIIFHHTTQKFIKCNRFRGFFLKFSFFFGWWSWNVTIHNVWINCIIIIIGNLWYNFWFMTWYFTFYIFQLLD